MRKWLFFASLALAAPQAALGQDKSPIDAGAEIYDVKCADCHGERLVNTGSAFDLKMLMAGERPRFDNSVMNGKGQMPAWKGMLTPQDLDKLWAYIRSQADN